MIFGWKLVSFRRKSPHISRFSLFLCFDKIAFTNSSDVTKDKGLCNTFIKLLEQSRILSNWRQNDHSRRNKFTQMGFQSSYSIPEFIDPHSTPKPLSTPYKVPSTSWGRC
ncbi:hypothetical protein T07_11013 [Trichinella nelsoni]|uniref:Uncharacterized protein n=1 Tax=Trichinella nelsoni TaxID=6336 RepID=A0A0V0SFG0_9BILA|nr:hypothetical protein T07_11013 [Trichinella nelsoni]